nr:MULTISPECIES: hypothetical protein [unclassified Synechocystis]
MQAVTVGEIVAGYAREIFAGDNYTDYLYPEQSTTAIITYHPSAKYFST